MAKVARTLSGKGFKFSSSVYSRFDYSEVFLLICSHGSTIVTAILNCWSSFDVWSGIIDVKEAMLMILKKVLLLDSKVCYSLFTLLFIIVLPKL